MAFVAFRNKTPQLVHTRGSAYFHFIILKNLFILTEMTESYMAQTWVVKLRIYMRAKILTIMPLSVIILLHLV